MSRLPLHSVSVIGVVLHPDDGRILVIQRADNQLWHPPGGIVELGEPLTEAVRREVAEETGVQVEPERCTGVYKNTVKNVVSIVFRARMVGGTPQPTTEAVAVDWWDIDTVLRHMPAMFAVRVMDSLAPPGSVTVRNHDGQQLLDTLDPPADLEVSDGAPG